MLYFVLINSVLLNILCVTEYLFRPPAIISRPKSGLLHKVITAKSLHMLFKDISPEKIFNFLKEINIFGNI